MPPTKAMQVCRMHPFVPMPDFCMRCCELEGMTFQDIKMPGASDLATSVYPEIDNSVSKISSLAMRHLLPMPSIAHVTKKVSGPAIAREATWFSKDNTAPFVANPTHDHYSERFALEPTEQQDQYAGTPYTDMHALDEEYRQYGRKTSVMAGKGDIPYKRVNDVEKVPQNRKNVKEVKEMGKGDILRKRVSDIETKMPQTRKNVEEEAETAGVESPRKRVREETKTTRKRVGDIETKMPQKHKNVEEVVETARVEPPRKRLKEEIKTTRKRVSDVDMKLPQNRKNVEEAAERGGVKPPRKRVSDEIETTRKRVKTDSGTQAVGKRVTRSQSTAVGIESDSEECVMVDVPLAWGGGRMKRGPGRGVQPQKAPARRTLRKSTMRKSSSPVDEKKTEQEGPSTRKPKRVHTNVNYKGDD
jgi:hypothetical protein